MPNLSGSVRSLLLDGVNYDVPADVNITWNLSEFINEEQATSGKTMIKRTFRTPTMEDVILVANTEEQFNLADLARREDAFPISATFADGSVARTTGFINYESSETETNRATVKIIPENVRAAWSAEIS